MEILPQAVLKAWEDRDGFPVLATVDSEGVPNIVYIGSVSIYNENCFVVADNYFDKTRNNILSGSKGALVFLDKQRKSYQVKGYFEYHTDGEIFTHMKTLNPPQHPGHAAVVLRVEEVYSGAKKLS